MKPPLIYLVFALILMSGGAGHAAFPFIALLGLPVAVVGAVIACCVAFSFRDPDTNSASSRIGAALLVIGTIVLLAGCLNAVSDVHAHILTAMRLEMTEKKSLTPAPGLRFLASWQPAFATLSCWLGATCLLTLGIKLRKGLSNQALLLLILCWLASAPLSILVFLWSYLNRQALTA